ncbi:MULTISPECIES: NYN domain-containing protein [Helicobacter]|uniref:NYN domain-containing protein n=1 Tax=Helicobacter bilis ATCC 43879 TaxID=613026 RepID=C3XEF4_9HELI|nr:MULTISPECIES: NYN domain-containing protein [Helicobacter]EEO23393.1 hypothetical protein HRAG_00450 [Helicobacter bilis ATCC 43879]
MAKNLALFIDCDRLEAAFMTLIFDYLQNEGYNICVKRAYITKDNLDLWYSQLDRHYFRISIGNSQANNNMRLSVDVSKALYSGNYDSIAIASNYREFGVLASEVRTKGLEALCFYQFSKGNEAFLKRAYNIIYNLEPKNVSEQSSEMTSTGDMLDIFASALEGLDTQTLGEKIGDQTTSAKTTTRKPRATKSTKATSTKATTAKKK